MIMKANLAAVRELLKSELAKAAPTRGLRESIRIHQAADPVDMTQQAAERELVVQNIDRESALARQLLSAIGRVDDGSYGLCLECEDEIAPKRLKALPWAELCIHCQDAADRSGGAKETELALAA